MEHRPIRRQQTDFVGRASTLRRLDHWLSDALHGSPRLGLVIGEPGVGKSRVVAEWLTRSQRDEMRVLVGACHEDVEIPFLPVAAAIEQLPGATDYLYPPEASTTAADSDVRRYLGAARRVVEAATHRPTVFVIHDVHWADPATLEFISQLTAMATRSVSTGPVRLLILLTARPSEGSAKVQSGLRRLRLDPGGGVDQLSGLDELEVNELLEGMLDIRPGRQFVRGVFEATKGNPLLIGLLIDRLDAEGQLQVTRGRVVSRSEPERFLVAADLEVAWRARLDLLSHDDRALLEVVALLGDESSSDDVKVAADLTDDGLEGFLERSSSAGLLSDDGALCRFHHPHLRTALVAALPGRRRQRLEAQIAARLWARYKDEGGTHVLSIVQHLRRSRSATAIDDVDGLRLAAAAQAGAAGMWGLAATYYEDALAALSPTTEPLERARLELRAGQAHHRNQDFPSAVPHHLAAIAAAKQADDLQVWGEALFWLSGANVLEHDGSGYYDDRLATEFLDRAGDGAPDERALILAYRAQHQFGRFDAEAGLEAITEANLLARTSDRVEIRHFVAHIEGVNRLGNLDLAGAEASFREAVALTDQHADPWLAVWPCIGMPLVHLAAGDLRRADEEAASAVESAADYYEWNLHGLALALRAAVAVGQGRLADGRYFANLAVQSYHRSEFFYAGAIAHPHLIATHAYVGDEAGARLVVERWRGRVGDLARIHALLVDAICGSTDNLRDSFAAHGDLSLPPVPSLFSVHPALVAVEVGSRLGSQDLLERALEHLQLLVHRGILFGVEWALSVHRAMAQAAVALDRMDEAIHLVDDAMDAARLSASPLEEARTRVARAQVRLASGAESGTVIADLRDALAYFDACQMTPFSEDARRVMPDAALGIRRDVVIVYTDLVESTRLNVSMGDTLFVELLREHNAVVRERLRTYGGVEFTHTGDGVGARFTSVDGALGFSAGLQARFDHLNERHPDFPLQVRIGIACGDAVEDRGNLFGQTVVRAVRICSCADTGQVLVGEEIVALADPLATRFRAVGRFALKGLEHRELFEVRRPGVSPEREPVLSAKLI